MSPEDLELLSELTIVIPTCNRPHELERAIEYWRDLPVTVHILDGSEKPWFPVGTFNEVTSVTYHHLPPIIGENWMENYSRRFLFAASLPKTKISALCGDDDFFSISGLKLAISRILNDTKTDAVVGVCAEYKYHDSELLWNLRYTNWRKGTKSQSNDVAERVLDRSGGFYLFYALMKSEIWRNVLSQTYKFAYLHSYPQEHLFNSIAMAYCKVDVLRHVIWVKKVAESNPEVVDQSSRIRESDWYRDKKNQKQVELIINHMATGIASAIINNNSSVSPRDLAESYVARISSFSETAKYRKYKRRYMQKIVSKLRFLPDFIKTSLNSLLPMRLKIWTGVASQIPHQHLTKNNFFVLDSLLSNLASTEISFNRLDLVSLEKLLLMPREELRLRANI